MNKYVAILTIFFSVWLAPDVLAQSNPTAQSLPYVQTFGLAASSTTYPTGFQGWDLSTATGTTYNTAAPSANRALTASSTAATTATGVHNFNGKIGILGGSTDASMCLAVVTTSQTNVLVSYDVMTIRNPYNGSTNTRINEVTLQYRVGTSGTFTSLTGIEYQNNTTSQTSGTTAQNSVTKSVVLPTACDNKTVVQLRWVQRDVSGIGARPSFAFDNIVIGFCNPTAQSLPYTQNFGTAAFSAYPAGFCGWSGMDGSSVSSQALALASVPVSNASLTSRNSAFSTEPSGALYGYATSSNGRLCISTSNNSTDGLNQPVCAISTGAGVTGVTIDYKLEVLYAGDRDMGIVLQYRSLLGNSAWVTVSGSATTYTTPAINSSTTKSHTVTGLTANTVYQFRWATWRVHGSGSSNTSIALDNISIVAVNPNSITTGSLGTSPTYCAGGAANIAVPFTFSPTANFPTGGSCVFTVQLSNSSGSFSAPINLENANSNGTGSQTINVGIPSTTATGTGYRIRIVSNSPAIDGSDNGKDITIVNPSVGIAPTGTQSLNASVNGTTLTATEAGTPASRLWKYGTVSGSYPSSTGVTATTYTPNFATPGTYYVACVSTYGAPCNTSVTSNEVIVNVSLPTISSLALSNSCVTTSTLGWSLPSGYVSGTNSVVIFAKPGSAVTVGTPSTSISTYTANANVTLGTVYQNDASARCVYKGDGTSVNLAGLTSGANYYFLAFNVIEPSTYSTGATANGNAGTTQNVTATSATGSYGGGTVNWTNPACYDEIMVVVNTTSGIGFAPAGDGSAYTANSYYTGVNQVVYKGTGTTFDISNLTNGTTYYAEIFTRRGSYWSSGVEVSIVPNTTIDNGNIIFTQVSGNADGFEFMTLERVDLSATRFTDQGICTNSRIYTAGSEFNSFTTNVASLTDVPAGTFIRVSLDNPGTNKNTTYDGYTLCYTGDGGSGVNDDGESIVCYTGTAISCAAGSGTNPYISGIHWGDNTGWSSTTAPDVHESKAPGTNTDIEIANTNGNIRYKNSASVTGNPAALISSIENSSNWESYTVGSDFATDASRKTILFNEANYSTGALSFSGVTTSQMTIDWSAINWTGGTNSSTRYAVVIYTSSPGNAVDRYTCYTPNTVYGSAPSVVTAVSGQTGTNFCGSATTGNGKVVYLGYGSSVTATGLAAGTTYTIKVFAVNGNGYTANYSSTPALGTKTTYPADPTGVITQTNDCGNTTLHHANATYYWQGNNTSGEDNSVEALTSNDYNTNVAGTYYIRAYNASCDCWSFGSQSVTVTVKAIPADPTGTVTQTNNCGNTVLQHANTNYYWQGTNATGTNSSTGVKTNNDYTATTAGTYYVRAYNSTDDCWSDNSQSVSVTVKTIPADPNGTVTQTNNCGNTVLQHANANYYWQGTNATGTNSSAGVKTNNDYTATMAGTYYVRAYNATDACWSTNSQSVTVAVKTIPADPTGTVTQTNNCDNVTLHHANADYYWQGTNATGTDNSGGVKTNNDYTTYSSGTYYIRAYNSSDACWSAGSQNVVVDIVIPTTTQWIGVVDTNWHTAGNWCPSIPDSTTDIVINSSATYQPVITTAAYCHNISIAATASATIRNHGRLMLYGNLSRDNAGSYIHTGGVLELRGAALQNIPRITADSVVVNNGAGVQLTGRLTIKKSLNLLYGVLATDTNIVDIQDTLVTAITPGNDTSWVYGNLRRAVGDTGFYSFPVGSDVHFEFAGVDIKANKRKALGGIDSLTARFNTHNTNCSPVPGAGGTSINGTELNGLLNGGFWTIHPDTATYTGVSYNVVLKERGFSNTPESADRMGVIKRVSCEQPWLSLGTHVNATQSLDMYTGTATAMRSALTSFSDFGIGFSGGGALPVTMLYIQAEAMENTYIQLSWATALEVNNYGFEVERSTDADVWTKVGFVKGNNNSTAEIAYSFKDTNVAANVRYYYRLKQVDNNGDWEYTDMVTAMLTGSNAFTVSDFFPNPTYNTAKLVIQSANDSRITVDVYNMIGEKVLSKTQVMLNENGTSLEFNLTGLAAGTYSAVVSSAGQVWVRKLVLTR